MWRQRSESTLVQVKTCHLAAPNHYLNQCWLLIKDVLWHSPESNFTISAWSPNMHWSLHLWNYHPIPHGQWVKLFTRQQITTKHVHILWDILNKGNCETVYINSCCLWSRQIRCTSWPQEACIKKVSGWWFPWRPSHPLVMAETSQLLNLSCSLL